MLASFGIAIVFVGERLHRLVLATTIVLLAYYIFGYAITRDAGDIFVGSSNRVSTLFLALAVFTFVLGRRRYDLPLAATVFLVATSAGGRQGSHLHYCFSLPFFCATSETCCTSETRQGRC